MKRITTLFTALLFIPVLFAQVEVEKLFQPELHINEQSDTLPYRIYVPSYTVKQPALVLWLHGKGERGNDNKKQLVHGIDVIADSVVHGPYEAILLAPQCPGDKMWSSYNKKAAVMSQAVDPTEVQLQLLTLLNEVIEKYNADPNRIYIMGISMGGFGVWDMITRWPEKFAAAVPICGGGDPTKAGLLKNLPIWAFHGQKDKIIKPTFTSTIMNELFELQDKGLSRMTLYPTTGHGAWTPAFKEPKLLGWLFAQEKK